jgi:hypothetical protein
MFGDPVPKYTDDPHGGNVTGDGALPLGGLLRSFISIHDKCSKKLDHFRYSKI